MVLAFIIEPWLESVFYWDCRMVPLFFLKSFLPVALVISQDVHLPFCSLFQAPLLCPSYYVGILQGSFYKLDKFHTIMVLEKGKFGECILIQRIRINDSFQFISASRTRSNWLPKFNQPQINTLQYDSSKYSNTQFLCFVFFFQDCLY